MTLTLNLAPRVEAELREMSAREGIDASQLAARLKAYAAENEAEELALADAGLEHRAQLLAEEDAK